MILAVCPKCYRVPLITPGGFMRCPEHGILQKLTLVHVFDQSSKASEPSECEIEESEEEEAPIIGKCRAKITSANSPEKGKRCGRPARFLDDRNRPVCGYHRPTYLQELRERNPATVKHKRRKQKRTLKRSK